MASAKPRRRLIVNADDFGLSTSVNRAVIQAHHDGILTSASLMVNADAFDEAVEFAKQNPKLGVGLHLTLCCGRSTLSAEEIPDLLGPRCRAAPHDPQVVRHPIFRTSAVAAGVKYFFSSAALSQLRNEIAAQFEKFERTGLKLEHLNGHLHFHLHPTIFSILQSEIVQRRVRAVRFMHDPLRIDWPLGRGRIAYRLSHALIFRLLSRRTRSFLSRENVRHTSLVFGLLEDGRISEEYILKLLPTLPSGDSELYSHPSLHDFKHEYDALVSPRVRKAVADEGIELVRYQDL
jgi:chitin disaccharide deacetylase